MRPMHTDFRLEFRGKHAKLVPEKPERLPLMPFEAGCELYRKAVQQARQKLKRAGHILAERPLADSATPLQVLLGSAALPFTIESSPSAVSPAQRRVIVICIECICRPEGNCKCKVVDCPVNNS